ncbi:hypothetical protein SNEBB_005321 [Seison nebaliae]|nr:hypothetical protein SNEBB_005321 [Seison nebaliae]
MVSSRPLICGYIITILVFTSYYYDSMTVMVRKVYIEKRKFSPINLQFIVYNKPAKVGGSTLFSILRKFTLLTGYESLMESNINLVLPTIDNLMDNAKSQNFSDIYIMETFHVTKFRFPDLPMKVMETNIIDDNIEKKQFALSIVRDPIEIFISYLSYYNGRLAGISLSKIEKFIKKIKINLNQSTMNKSHQEVEVNFLRNNLCRHICGTDYPSMVKFADNSKILREYLKKLKKYYNFVGLTSHFELTLLALSKYLKHDFFLYTYIKINKNKKIFKKYQITESQKMIIGDWMKVDRMVYQEFEKLFWKKVSKLFSKKTVTEYRSLSKIISINDTHHTNVIVKDIARFRVLNKLVKYLCINMTGYNYLYQTSKASTESFYLNNNPFCLLYSHPNIDILMLYRHWYKCKYSETVNLLKTHLETFDWQLHDEDNYLLLPLLQNNSCFIPLPYTPAIPVRIAWYARMVPYDNLEFMNFL